MIKDFLSEWLADRGRRVEVPIKHRSCVTHDEYDEEGWDDVIEVVPDLKKLRVRLDMVGEGRGYLARDCFYSLCKARPEFVQPGALPPPQVFNFMVLKELLSTPNWERLHSLTVGDDLAAAKATVMLGPDIERIIDWMEANSRLNPLSTFGQKMVEYDDLADALEDLKAEYEGQPEDRDYQTRTDLINQQLNQLAEELGMEIDELEDQYLDLEEFVNITFTGPVEEIAESTEALGSLGLAWGLSKGEMRSLPADQRLELMEYLDDGKIKEIAKLFGAVERMSFGEQSKKVVGVPEEVFNVSLGGNIEDFLIEELMMLGHEAAQYDLYRRIATEEVSQYVMRGKDKVARGGIFCFVDSSVSMDGARDIWAKAIALSLLKIARDQKREYVGCLFGTSNVLHEWDFRGMGTTGKVIRSVMGREGSEEIPYVKGVIDFASSFLSSGTDYVTPLSHGVVLLQEEFEEEGAVKGDIVFITDGECGVPPAWLEKFQAEKERLQFRCWGIMVGHEGKSEPLNTICDGKFWRVSDIASGSDIADLFREI
jgi:uncharacterized protein with von Willebrand factor type A (vWA) domain